MSDNNDEEHDLICNPELMELFKESSAVKQEIMTSNNKECQSPLEEYSSSRSDMRSTSEDILKSLKKEFIHTVNENDIQSLHEEIDLGCTVIKEEEEVVYIAGPVNDDCGRTNLSPGNPGSSQSNIKLELFQERVNYDHQNVDLTSNHQQLGKKHIHERAQLTSTCMLRGASEENNSTLKLNTCNYDKGNSNCISSNNDTIETLNTITTYGFESQRIGKRNENTILKKNNKPFACDHCPYKCSYKFTLKQHLRIHEKPYMCNFCAYKSSKRSRLVQHVKTHTGEKPYACNICSRKFIQKTTFIIHQRSHTGEKPYVCPNCSFKSATKFKLTNHLRTHTGEKPYVCPYCPLKFSIKGILKYHLRTHSKDKPYTCNFCSYKYSERSYLVRHLRTHTGEKPYACNICSRKFIEKYDLIIHQRSHTREKPYACDVCPYKCTRKSNLGKHLRTHTGDKPYLCDVCPYKCSEKSNLSRHILTHTQDKPYACDHCPYKCSQKSILKQHLRTHGFL